MSEQRIDPQDWEGAIADCNGPQLVVAGPGTGKTEFLVRRAAHLIDARGVGPDELALLAFSRRGAAELRRRVEDTLDRSYRVVPASTFHSFCYRLLETYAPETFGWNQMPSLLTGPEQVELVGELLQREVPEAWPLLFRELLPTRTFAEEVTDFLLRSQEQLLDPAGLAARAQGRDDWRALPRFLLTYLEELRSRQRIDYGTLQAEAVRLLDDPQVGEAVASQYRYLLVDEYQDTTRAQASLLQRLYGRHRNLTVAADPYQSVYSFRGTEIGNVAEFPPSFPDVRGDPARRLVLSTSFRVPREILQAAERITAEGRLPGAAGPVRPAPHEGRVEAVVFDQHSYEAGWIAAEVERLHLVERIPYGSMAVLVRTKRRILPELSRALERRRIPHDPPDARLAHHPAVRLVLDCVAAATTHSESPETDQHLRRILLGPLFALPLGVERELQRTRRRADLSWGQVLAEEVDGGQALAALLEDASWARELPASDGFWQLWTRLPQFARLVDQHEYRSWRAAWSSLAQALGRQAERDASVSLQDYLHRSQQEEFEAQPLLSFRHEDGDRLTLTTLHQAKGLEFEVVFIADAVEGVFPDLRTRSSLLEPRLLSPARPTEPALSARFRLQEEMRLAYMGMTRARRRVVCTATSPGYGQQEGGPSRFLLLATGVESAEQLDGRPDPPWPPVTPLEAEAYLRGIARDPRQGPARRLASMAALAQGSAYGLRPPHCFVGHHRRGPDVGLVPPDLALSPSQADAYQVCPRRYALERRLGMDGGPGLHAELGALLHRVLEEVERAAMERDEVHGSLADALEELDRAWQPRAFGGGAWAEAWRRRAEAILRKLYGHWPGSSPAIALEHPLRLRLNGVAWRGRADRIEAADGVVRVVDYKTGKQAASLAEARRSLQLGFYLLAAAHDPALTRHGRPAHAEFWYPAHKSKDCTVRTFDPHNLPMVEADLARVAEGILAEDWAPTVGEACDRCPVRLVCPAWPEGREAFLR